MRLSRPQIHDTVERLLTFLRINNAYRYWVEVGVRDRFSFGPLHLGSLVPSPCSGAKL